VEIKEIPEYALREFKEIFEALSKKYRVLGFLGKGGFSQVFLLEDKLLRRKCALKVLSSQVTGFSSEAVERFLREARLYAELEHPHIVPIYDVGFEGNRAYLIMKYIEGRNLRDIISRSGSLPMEAALKISRDILSALSYMHARGIIHRDIKPSNIIIEEGTGRAILTDFGLAKRVDAGTKLTRSGQLLGTPHYLSPEQARGEKITPASDVYSFGITLFEMLTGRLPFEGDSPLQILWKHVKEPLPEPRKVNPSLPAEVERIIFKATEKKPANRYSSAAEMLRDIEALREKARLTRSRRSRLPLLLASLVLAAVLGALGYFLSSRGARVFPLSLLSGRGGWTEAALPPGRTLLYSEILPMPVESREVQEDLFPPVDIVGEELEGEGFSGEFAPGPTETSSPTLTLKVDYPARVEVDGREVGEVLPGKALTVALKVGEHTVKYFPLYGGQVQEQVITLGEGERKTVVRKFGFSSMLTTIDSKPWANVYIDGRFMGTTPINKLSLASGEHIIKFVRKGYKPEEVKLFLKPDERRAVSVILKREEK